MPFSFCLCCPQSKHICLLSWLKNTWGKNFLVSKQNTLCMLSAMLCILNWLGGGEGCGHCPSNIFFLSLWLKLVNKIIVFWKPKVFRKKCSQNAVKCNIRGSNFKKFSGAYCICGPFTYIFVSVTQAMVRAVRGQASVLVFRIMGKGYLGIECIHDQ